MKIFGIPIPFTRQSTAPIPDDRYFAQLIASSGEVSNVTPQTSVNYTPVFAAIRVIAGNLSALPLITYERQKDGGKEKAVKHPLYKLLKTKPNRRKTHAFEFREMLTAHMLLYGNGYAQIIRNSFGDPLEFYPMHPTQVTPELRGQELIYRVRLDNGGEAILPEYEVLHLRAFRDCGLAGLSPIAAAKKAIEAGLSLESFGTNFFVGGAFPAGVLEYDQGGMSEDAKKNLRESWQTTYGGQNRGRKVAVLEAGLKWKPMGIPQSDAQFLEQRRFGVEEIARIYGVPPHLLGDLSRSTNNNIEMQSQGFVSYCLRPWMERWEQTVVRDLLDGDDETYFVKHNANALLRGDSAARGMFYSQGRQWGWFSINDVRSFEDMNPIGPEGDVYLSPLNMVPAGQEGEDQHGGNDGGQEPQQQPQDKEGEANEAEVERVKAAFRGAFKETWQRVARKGIGSVKTAAKKMKGDEFRAWLDEFGPEHRAFSAECLREIRNAYLQVRGFEPSGECLVFDEYVSEVRADAIIWLADPSGGYGRDEEQVASYWTERLLGYSEDRNESATAI